jgi:hypothetical protein
MAPFSAQKANPMHMLVVCTGSLVGTLLMDLRTYYGIYALVVSICSIFWLTRSHSLPPSKLIVVAFSHLMAPTPGEGIASMREKEELLGRSDRTLVFLSHQGPWSRQRHWYLSNLPV